MPSHLSPFLALLVLTLALPLSAQEGEVVYHLKANDQISLSVFGEADMSQEVQLTVTGEASLPLIGAVQLRGKTLKEAEAEVTRLYKGDYLIEPQISINLLNAADERVTVMGAVMRPGPVGIPANTTLDLIGAIGSAGGLAPQADPDQVELMRGETSQTYSLDALRREGAAPVMLAHGDKVNVPLNPFANKNVTIVGELAKTGTFPFPPNGKLDVATLVGLAGGLTPEADPARVTVKRDGNIFGAALPGAGPRLLQPGDIVTVPKSRFVGKYVTMMGQVGKPGPLSFPIDGKLDILTAISLAGGFDNLANKKKVVVTRRIGEERQFWTIDIAAMELGKGALFQLAPGDSVSVPVRRF